LVKLYYNPKTKRYYVKKDEYDDLIEAIKRWRQQTQLPTIRETREQMEAVHPKLPDILQNTQKIATLERKYEMLNKPAPEVKKSMPLVLQWLSKLDKPQNAIFGAVTEALRGKSALEGLKKGWSQTEDYTGEKILQTLGMNKGLGRKVAGFAIDVIADPLNLLGSAPVKAVLQGAKKLATTEKVLNTGLKALQKTGIARIVDTMVAPFSRDYVKLSKVGDVKEYKAIKDFVNTLYKEGTLKQNEAYDKAIRLLQKIPEKKLTEVRKLLEAKHEVFKGIPAGKLNTVYDAVLRGKVKVGKKAGEDLTPIYKKVIEKLSPDVVQAARAIRKTLDEAYETEKKIRGYNFRQYYLPIYTIKKRNQLSIDNLLDKIIDDRVVDQMHPLYEVGSRSAPFQKERLFSTIEQAKQYMSKDPERQVVDDLRAILVKRLMESEALKHRDRIRKILAEGFTKHVEEAPDTYLTKTNLGEIFPELKDKAIHPEVYRHIVQAQKLQHGNKYGALKSVQAFNSLWKKLVTMSPRFHAVNLLGGIYQNWLGADNMAQVIKDYINAGRKIVRKDENFLRAMRLAGIDNPVAFLGSSRAPSVELIENILNRNKHKLSPFKLNQKLGSIVEKINRTAALERGLQRSGGDIRKAIDYVNKLHFDYSSLTPTEQAIRDLAIPFYTWLRKNLPLQAEMLVKKPYKVNNIYDIIQNQMMQEDVNPDLVPEAYQDIAAIPLKHEGGKVYYLGIPLPVADLFRIRAGNKEAKNDVRWENLRNLILSGLSPVIKAPLELHLGKEITYSDKPIKNTKEYLLKTLLGVPGRAMAMSTTDKKIEDGATAKPDIWTALGLSKKAYIKQSDDYKQLNYKLYDRLSQLQNDLRDITIEDVKPEYRQAVLAQSKGSTQNIELPDLYTKPSIQATIETLKQAGVVTRGGKNKDIVAPTLNNLVAIMQQGEVTPDIEFTAKVLWKLYSKGIKITNQNDLVKRLNDELERETYNRESQAMERVLQQDPLLNLASQVAVNYLPVTPQVTEPQSLEANPLYNPNTTTINPDTYSVKEVAKILAKARLGYPLTPEEYQIIQQYRWNTVIGGGQ